VQLPDGIEQYLVRAGVERLRSSAPAMNSSASNVSLGTLGHRAPGEGSPFHTGDLHGARGMTACCRGGNGDR
jgi:hypothetical protein